MQKTFTVDFLTKKKKINEGEVQQYYIENSHPAIIPPETFDLVQIEIKKRKGQRKSTAGVFASRLICGECGGFYGSKVWHSNTKYRRTILQCNHKFQNKKQCSTPHFDEIELKRIFIDVFNSSLENRTEILKMLIDITVELTDTSEIDTELDKLHISLQTASVILRDCVEENAHRSLNQEEYERRYKSFADEYKSISDKICELENQKTLRIAKQKESLNVIHVLEENNAVITQFDENLFHSLVDTITVKSDKELVFKFKEGSESLWDIEPTQMPVAVDENTIFTGLFLCISVKNEK